jgi:DegV family protein with EDD domain
VTEAAAARAQRGFAYCALDTLEYLQKGGRIGAAQAFVGSLLKVKPILRVADGQVEPLERPRNMRRAVQRLEELIRGHGPASKLAVAYATDPAAADDLLSRLSDLVPADQSYTMQIGSAIGTHGGPGAIGVATLP